MPILIKPKLDCNFSCDYCYESKLRNNLRKSGCFEYDIDKIIEKAEEEYNRSNSEIVLHGGEITLIPVEDLERLLKFAFEKTGRTSLQTNGYAITDAHIELFKKYNTNVGVSFDGTYPLNKFRVGGTEEERRKKSDVVMKNIEKLIDELGGGNVATIAVINSFHGEETNIVLFKQWVKYLQSKGVVNGRMNPLQPHKTVEGNKADIEETKLINFYLDMADYVLSDPTLMWQPFRDVVDNLLGLGTGTCVFTKCDIYNTTSAYTITGNGHITTCLHHSAKDGDTLLRNNSISEERYELLQKTPQEYGGCKDCKYWRICYGYCPTSAINSDWRNRTVHCNLFKALFEHVEKKLRGLMPNVKLITDLDKEYYQERHYGGMGRETLALLLSERCPSTWRGGQEIPNRRNSIRKRNSTSETAFKSAEEVVNDLGLKIPEGDTAENLLDNLGWIPMDDDCIMPDGTQYNDNGYLIDVGGWKHADHTDVTGGGKING